MIKYDVLNRYTGEVQFTAEIDCDDNAPNSIKLGLAVKWAVKNKADLRYTNLRYANLRDADLRWVDLRDADLCNVKNAIIPVTIGQVGEEIRTGYAIYTDKGIMVRLGCFYGTEKEAIEAVSKKYGARSGYAMMVRSACKLAKERGILNPTEETNDK